jgi:hypothetical protein
MGLAASFEMRDIYEFLNQCETFGLPGNRIGLPPLEVDEEPPTTCPTGAATQWSY